MRIRYAAGACALALVALGAHAGTAPGELKAGDQAPQFSLSGSDGRTYRLSAYRGKQYVVLAWFAKAFTSG